MRVDCIAIYVDSTHPIPVTEYPTQNIRGLRFKALSVKVTIIVLRRNYFDCPVFMMFVMTKVRLELYILSIFLLWFSFKLLGKILYLHRLRKKGLILLGVKPFLQSLNKERLPKEVFLCFVGKKGKTFDKRPVRLGVRTQDFHSWNTGSIPVRATTTE